MGNNIILSTISRFFWRWYGRYTPKNVLNETYKLMTMKRVIILPDDKKIRIYS